MLLLNPEMLFNILNLEKGKTNSNDKGIIFEMFAKEFFGELGYQKIEFRRKIASLEFDLTAEQILDPNKHLICEAKGKKKKIDASTIFAFLGKMELEWDENENSQAVFFSLSDLTAEAKDGMSRIAKKFNFLVYAGHQLLEKLEQIGKVPSQRHLASIAAQSGMKCGEKILSFTNRGLFTIQLLIPEGWSLPRYFLVLRGTQEVMEDTNLISLLQKKTDELRNLVWFGKKDIEVKEEDGRILTPIIESGSDWFDYKLPAPPKYFIGRNSKLEEFNRYLIERDDGTTRISIFQVLSKSGVGKSSFLLKTREITEKKGWISLIFDLRDIRNSIDIFSIMQNFVIAAFKKFDEDLSIPITISEVNNYFSKINERLNSEGIFGVFFFDQIEGLFHREEVFIELSDLIFDVLRKFDRILFVIARKNDYLTTIDDRPGIDIDRLNNSSKWILLQDFDKIEALELIHKLSSVFDGGVKKQLITQIFERSNGFPWLHKRLCYHIKALHQKGISQEEIIQSGLKIESLFQEEIEGLDELEKEFLRDLVKYLPATIWELNEYIQDREYLKKSLQRLQSLRLIRLTGNSYDTYNDFFKEFIKTGSIPIKSRYLLKQTPGTVEKWLRIFISKNYNSFDAILSNEDIKRGTLFNVLRDMQLLGILTKKADLIDINEFIKNQPISELGSYLKNVLFQNVVFKNILREFSNKPELNFDQIVLILKKNFPLREASERTWLSDSKKIVQWLDYCNFDSELQIDLTRQRVGKRKRNDFYPEYVIKKHISIMKCFDSVKPTERNSFFRSNTKGSERVNGDLKLIGFIEENSRGFYLTTLGKKFTKAKPIERSEIISDVLLKWPNIQLYLKKLKKSRLGDSGSILTRIAKKSNRSWSPETAEWYFKNLKSWLKFANLAIQLGPRRKKIYHPDRVVRIDQFMQKPKRK